MPETIPSFVEISRGEVEASGDVAERRVARMAQLSIAVREIFAHQIRLVSPHLSESEIRRETARRIYRNDQMIQRFLSLES